VAQGERCVLLRPPGRLLALYRKQLAENGHRALRDQKRVPKLATPLRGATDALGPASPRIVVTLWLAALGPLVRDRGLPARAPPDGRLADAPTRL
jgi:hypothetical protein